MASTISAAARNDLRAFVKDFVRAHTLAENLAEVEALAVEIESIVGQAVLEAGLERVTWKASYQGSRYDCECGRKARFVGYRSRWIKSSVGETKVKRAYYHCEHCKQGYLPWDAAQGLNERVWTPGLKATVCRVAARVSYSETVDLLSELGVADIEESSAEAIVLEVGKRLRADDQDALERTKTHLRQELADKLLVDLPEERQPEKVAPTPNRVVEGKRLYMACDAAKAHIDGSWHNVNCGMVFTVQADKEGKDHLRDRHYVAMQANMETFGWELRRLAEEWSVSGYAEQVFLGDGAPCNWNLARTHFPAARQILDFYHASEHLGELAHVLYDQNDPVQKERGDRWLSDRLSSLKHKGPRPLLRALKLRSGKGTVQQAEAVRQMLGYVAANAFRMNYHDYIDAGLMIGSGPIEAACKVIVGQRLKLSGMRWSEPGADAVLGTRTTILNKQFDKLAKCARAA